MSIQNRQSEPLKPEPLKPESLPLTGCHLIEASAGTGKTFNITRLYLRFLLEQKLDVKNILVMTFTRAATEELRSRIAKEIRSALENWEQFDKNDTFFATLTQQFTYKEAYPALHNALLHLDEASIFTIHSFCKRVLSQQAFNSGVAFNVQMETDTTDIELEAVRDWYRLLAKQKSSIHDSVEDYQCLAQSWSTPENFRQAFREVLSSNIPVQFKTIEQIIDHFNKQKQQALLNLEEHKTLVFAEMIDSHKQKDVRAEEWNELVFWLNTNYANGLDSQEMPKSAAGVFNGTRYARKAPEIKQPLSEAFEPLKQLKIDAGNIELLINKAYSYQIAAQGIDVIRSKIESAKQRKKVMNYDDLINQLAQSLNTSDETKNNKLAELIRSQYPVALVDEFQDTDPNQYAILKCIYHNQQGSESKLSTGLFMIGDPKQAIYAFRSGDVFTYLSAREDTDQQWIMDTNWRSSTKMINAYNRLFYGASLKPELKSAQKQKAKEVFGFNIQYSPVKSAGVADKQNDHSAALQLIHFPFHEAYRAGRSKKEEMKQDFCPVIAQWCAREIHQLLSGESSTTDDLSLQEQDIAILVRDKKEASYIQDALRKIGFPSVYLSTHDNVFFSEEATELEHVLSGILELENERLLIAALSTRFLGGNTQSLFALQEDEEQWESSREQVFKLRELWLKRGFMAMALKLLHQNFVPQPDHHQRSLTNAIQLFELLQQASQRHRQPEQLLNWLREQQEAQSGSSEAELRLESDANLIRIITQHGSKGLEYPIVFIPFATRYKDPAKFGSKNIDLYKYHEQVDHYQLNYFIGQDKTITEQYRTEAWAESIRLLYVAITRAKFRCYLCATPFSSYHLSPLGQTLKLNAEDDLHSALSLLETDEPEAISLYDVSDIDSLINEKSINRVSVDEILPTDSAAQFTGRIERNWWLSSFSALTRNLRHGGISTPDRDQDDATDEVTSNALRNGLENDLENHIRFSLTKGAATGNFLHDILEHTDFLQANWQRSLERPLTRFNESLDTEQQDELIQWLEVCLNVPLESGLGTEPGPKLNELNWSQTLRETEFYFPMEQVKPYQLGQLLLKHRQQRLSQYAKNDFKMPNNNPINLPGNRALQGMMHGFIDLIFQWQGKFYIVDYKSTHLGNHFNDYEPDALDKNIRDNYYDLQYLLYSLALHRYLKSRKPDYDPQAHFGGIHYLYLRGMNIDSQQGVFSTPISPDLLQEMDELFSSQQTVMQDV
ncbi:MAG: exodeoxyribonuclease V subunit beta [Gammaproteobacteria bacterium]|nr:exodeoxyribonuclease V subunit beta [Gammaproteobacteria bacterium]